ncbi:hypothetical protein H0H81_005752 [Sphagnurus paluster]|uniref:DUF6699 domain-containing protein n=1 Tax=Sphagnurus paluster TaxID=117069 RepID=A0A9P7FU58_9AGAR|nr:hypothetical protein H0H81_005752 [Sphagnurus paluster]
MQHYPASSSASKSYSTVDRRGQSSSTYSSWGTISTTPTSLTSASAYPSALGSPAPALQLHPALHPPPAHQLPWDIRTSPPPVMDIAFKPTLTKTCLSVRGFPEFTFNVENMRGVTVYDILYTIHARLNTSMTRADLERYTPQESAHAQASFHARTQNDREAYSKGMRFLDRLAGRLRFVGLTPSSTPGVWEIHFA